ncbi:MAG: GumC family protein [Phycisphaerales bacterium JB064]
MNSQQDSHLDAWMEPEAPQGQGQAANPLLLVHRALRGRYLIALAIGAVLAIPGALVGYRFMPEVYTSTGVVTIDPTKPVLLYDNEENEAITGFESFVRSQARTLESPRVMQEAAKRLAERGVMSPNPSNWVRLQRSTQVSVPRGGRDMIVNVTMRDPRLAKDAAETILKAYKEIADEESNSTWKAREDGLKQIISTSTTDRDSYLRLAREKAQAQGTVDLDRRRLFVQEQVEALDKQIQSLTIDLPALRDPTPQESETTPQELTPEEYAQLDTELASLMTQRRSIEQRMTALLSRVTERHPDFLAAQDELKSVNGRITTRLGQLKEMGLEEVTGAGIGGYRQRLAALERIRDKYAEEAALLSSIALQIDSLEAQAQNEQERLDLANQRLESLTTERQNATEGRVRIAQEAEVPVGPSEDRRMPLAAMGAAGGFGITLVAFAAYGIVRPRYRFVADLEDESASPPVLGLVPQVSEGRIEGDEAAQAGVHQIRSLLESVPHSGMARVIVVTSATAAEGKSTLAAALSASMAKAGRNTLLIDSDLIGRGVTSRLSARQLTGLSDLVADGGAISDGYIHEVEGRSHLDLMPAGIAQGFEPEQLSSQAMEDLINALRNRYDAIVIDTGPILGSLEANAAVPQADQVVLVVSRGQNARLVKVAIDRLRRFQVGRIGLVFNRAARADIERSTSAASVSVRSRASSRPAAEQAPPMSASA